MSRWVRLLCRPLEIRPVEPSPADAIVILGAAPGRARDERVAVGADLWRRELAPMVVVTGRGEAGQMAAALERLGVAAAAIAIEDRATTTRENAARSAELLGRDAAVLVVSQPFHLRRAIYLFRAAGLRPTPVAAADSIQDRRPDLALRWAIREYAAWLKVGFGL